MATKAPDQASWSRGGLILSMRTPGDKWRTNDRSHMCATCSRSKMVRRCRFDTSSAHISSTQSGTLQPKKKMKATVGSERRFFGRWNAGSLLDDARHDGGYTIFRASRQPGPVLTLAGLRAWQRDRNDPRRCGELPSGDREFGAWCSSDRLLVRAT